MCRLPQVLPNSSLPGFPDFPKYKKKTQISITLRIPLSTAGKSVFLYFLISLSTSENERVQCFPVFFSPGTNVVFHDFTDFQIQVKNMFRYIFEFPEVNGHMLFFQDVWISSSTGDKTRVFHDLWISLSTWEKHVFSTISGFP